MLDFQNFILTIVSSFVEILSRYLKGQYEVITYNLPYIKSNIWLKIAIVAKLIEILLKPYVNSDSDSNSNSDSNNTM